MIASRIKLMLTSVLLFVVTIAGCDFAKNEDELQYVVEAYLEANSELPPIALTRSQPVNDVYDFTSALVQDASVTVQRLDTNGNVEVEVPYVFDEETGRYLPSVVSPVVPGKTFRFRADIGGDIVSSETIIPGEFELLSTNTDVVTYQGPVQYEVTVSESAYPGRQVIFIFSTVASDVRLDNLVPLAAEFIDGDEDALDDVRILDSAPLNEANFDDNMNGTLSIKLPWLAVAFYGENEIWVSAIDDNLFDIIRSQNIQQGGSTFAPGEIPNIIDRVDGGTGIFGSYARVTATVTINR